MISVNFSSVPFTASDKRVTVKNDGVTHKPDFEGRKGVACLSKSAYLTLTVEKGTFPTGVVALTLSFYIEKSMNDDRMLLYGDGVPFHVNLRAAQGGYRVETVLRQKELTQSFTSTTVIRREEWHELGLLLLDGECILTLDGKAQGRRVFIGELGVKESWKLFLGKRLDNSVTGGFFGYLDSLSLADSLTAAQEAIAEKLAEEGLGEIESKQAMLAAQGVTTGAQQGQKTLLDPSTPSCFYVRFQNGGIVRSPAHGCAWLSSPLLSLYLGTLKQSAIGLPLADEVLAEESGFVYCLCDAGGLFHGNGLDCSMPADFLTEYADKGLFSSPYGLPLSPVMSLSLVSGGSFFYQRFTEAVFIRVETGGQQGVPVVLPRWVGNEVLNNAQVWGVPMQYLQGYRGNIRDDFTSSAYVKADYLITDRTVVCFNTYIGYDGKESYQKFVPDPDMFAFFKASGGLSNGGKTPFGPYKCLTAPLQRTALGTAYHDCAEGVLVRYPKETKETVHGYTEITIYLRQISARKIDDGTDSTPELYIEVMPMRNGVKLLDDAKRWPDYSARKHGGSSFLIRYEGKAVTAEHKENTSVYYSFPRIHGADKLRLRVESYDYDKVTKNDYLGFTDIQLDVETGWGLRESFLKPGDYLSSTGTHSGLERDYYSMYLTESHGDNRGGRQNIKLDFSITGGKVVFDLNSYFRKYGYWSVDNFHSAEGLSRDTFDRTFHATTGHWYDWILHFWDNVWYEAAESSYSGKGGNCFGLSAEALLCLNGAGNYGMPLNDPQIYSSSKLADLYNYGLQSGPDGFTLLDNYPKKAEYDRELAAISDPKEKKEREQKQLEARLAHRYVETSNDLDPGFFQVIRTLHLYQLGWAHVRHTVNLAISGSLFNPSASFRSISSLLKSGSCCLVNGFGNGAHTMLAYKYELKNGADIIYVADPNHPWWEDTGRKDGSYLRLTGGTVPKVELHCFKGGRDITLKAYDYCYMTPLRLLLNQPRVPSWLELTGFVIETILRIPEFCARNLAEFLYVIACGDVEVGVGSKDGSAFGVPVFEAPLANLGGQALRLLVVQAEDATVEVKGKQGQEYALYVGGRGKLFRASGKLKEKGLSLEAQRMGRQNAALRVKAGKNVSTRSVSDGGTTISEIGASPAAYGKRAKQIARVDKSSRAASNEKRYYLNLRSQRNGLYEVHTENCPFVNMIVKSEYLGIHKSPESAFEVAKDYIKFGKKVDGCRFCCRGSSKG